MRLPASCSRAAHDPAGAAGGKVCLVEDANAGREASLEFRQRSSAPDPHHSRHLTQPHRARRYFSRLSGPTYAILRPGAKKRFLISFISRWTRYITGTWSRTSPGTPSRSTAAKRMLWRCSRCCECSPIQFRNGDWITVVTHATGVTGGANPGAVRRIHPGCSFLPGLVFRQTSVPSVPFPISSIGQEGNGNAVTGSQAAGSS